MNGIIMNDKVHATDKTNLEIKVSKETFTQMIQDGTLIEGATYKVTGYEDDIVISSKQVGYDNTTSQLAATNSQDAIDEINGKIGNISDDVVTANTNINNIQKQLNKYLIDKVSTTTSAQKVTLVLSGASNRKSGLILITQNSYEGSIYALTCMDSTYSLIKLAGRQINDLTYAYTSDGKTTVSATLNNWSNMAFIGI